MHITVPGYLKALIYIGAVASAILFPLGLSILISHYYRERKKGIIMNSQWQHKEQFLYLIKVWYVVYCSNIQ